ncbi:hypothetical protein [Listeria goaensis]|uniref:hypothetical protein n=1 Tax=Listeria goaensis TaxID=1649188 RepID=UPI000B5934F4|nr:hypothetical protein [Listeria goaensis]
MLLNSQFVGLGSKISAATKLFSKKKYGNIAFAKRVKKNYKTMRYTVNQNIKSLKKQPVKHLKRTLDWRAGKRYRKLVKKILSIQEFY